MSEDQSNKKKTLSEISHLFLSDLRDNATGGVRPKRLPPGSPRANAPKQEVSIDLTPEEYARSFGSPEPEATPSRLTAGQLDDAPAPMKPVSAIIAGHLNGKTAPRVRQYAKHLAAEGKRIGLIEVDVDEIRISCFDRGTPEQDMSEPLQTSDTRDVAQSLAELAWDIDRWLLLVKDLRPSDARKLLRKVGHWVLLSTCDHDGVVSCYRSIKGLSDGHRPQLSLALLNATDEKEAGRVYRKVAGVCQQFLNWPLSAEPAVEPADFVGEHAALRCRSVPNPSRGAVPHWQVVSEFLTRSPDAITEAESPAASEPAASEPFDFFPEPERGDVKTLQPKRLTEVVFGAAVETAQPTPAAAAAAAPIAQPAMSFAMPAMTATDDGEVTDLGTGEPNEASIVSAVLKKASLGLVETPLHPPTAPQAVLAVSRDRKLVVLAVANQGLSELRNLGQAYRWVVDNRPLLSMALPQFAIDAHAMPSLKLLVDRRDASADVLQPLMASENVSIQTYRKLRWGDRTGLLLEAA